MIYLDTHVVVWLYAGLVDKFSPTVKALINDHDLYISPMVRLELQYLYEVERVTAEANAIVTDLENRIGLQVCSKEFDAVVGQAITFPWTRDPFDRLIVAHAGLNLDVLVTKDARILANYPHARW